MVKTTRSTLHMLYNIQLSATQESNHYTTVTQDSHNNQV